MCIEYTFHIFEKLNLYHSYLEINIIHNQDHFSLNMSIEMKIQEWKHAIKKPHPWKKMV